MKKYLAVIFIGVLLFTGCGKIRHSRSHYVRPSHPQIRHGRYVRPSHRSTYRSPVRHGSSRSNHIRR